MALRQLISFYPTTKLVNSTNYNFKSFWKDSGYFKNTQYV